MSAPTTEQPATAADDTATAEAGGSAGLNGLGTPIQGVTLYSFTRFWHGRQMSFPRLVREVAARGLGPGLEIVGFQSIRDFPRVGEDFVRQFRQVIDETGLIPTALGANADAGLRRDRMLTNDELVEYMAEQMAAAKTLGFKIVRVQFSVTPDDMERLLPLAERYDLTLGMEIHAHHSPHHQVMQALLERFEKLGSPRLGFIPDWGATMSQMPRTLLESYRRRGINPDLIAAMDSFWNSHHGAGGSTDVEQGAQFDEAMELAQRYGHPEIAIEVGVNSTALFGHADPREWADVLRWAVHSHGKFYEINDGGTDSSIPLTQIMELYLNSGYSKTISSEWEGFHWNTWDNAFDVIAAQQSLLRRTAEQLGSRIITDAAQARALRGW